MERNLLVAFLLTGVVLAVSQYFIKPSPPLKNTPKQEPTTEANAQKPPAEPPAPVAPVTMAAAPGQVHADAEEATTVETKVFRVVFSNRGGVVRSWHLKGFKDHHGKELELVYEPGLTKVAPPFSLAFKSGSAPTDLSNALFKVTKSPDNLSLTYDYSDGKTAVHKTFVFLPESFLVEVSSEVTQNGVRVPHSLAWRGGFGDATVATPATEGHSVHYDVGNSKLITNDAKAAKDGAISASGQFSFAGLEDHYFAGVFLPAVGGSLEITSYADTVPIADGKEEQRVGASVGGDGLNRFTFFAGPKDADLLRRVNPRLEQLIDWGTWFGFIAKPLFLALNWTADKVTHNYGWAIILVTVVINILMFPMRFSSIKSARKMQAIQPQVNAINEKIKSMPMKDPRRADLNQELMALYSKNGVNPVGGCLPLVVQLPFLVALSTVLSVAIELRGASWLWVTDLSQPETIAIRVLPVLLVVIQFVTQRMTPTPGMDPAQQKMMMFMPIIFGYMFYWASAGLALYWLTGGLVGLAQQWILNKMTPAPTVATVIPPPKKKRT